MELKTQPGLSQGLVGSHKEHLLFLNVRDFVLLLAPICIC